MKQITKTMTIWWFVFLTFPVAQSQTVKVAAAADLRYVMANIVEAYKTQNPNANIEVVYGSSGNAYQQIKNGADFDLYFSADISFPQMLVNEGLAIAKPKLYAIGRLVLWSAKFPVNKGIDILKDPTIKRIAIANPDHAPYGAKAVQSLKHYALYDAIKDKLVYGENISQAAQFVVTGNADVGLIAYSLALSPTMMGNGNYALIDEKSHAPLQQAYVRLKKSERNPECTKFVEFVATKQARNIFVKFGFVLPNDHVTK